MTGVVHESVAVTRMEVEGLARRLLALRSEIDEILAALAFAPAAQACATGVSAPSASTNPATSRSADDLTLIRGIDAELSDQLGSLGFDTFSQIARWSKRDVIYVAEALGLDRRICRENWIEQAAILASGKMTASARGGSEYPRATDWDAGARVEPSSEAEARMQIAAGKRPPGGEVQSAPRAAVNGAASVTVLSLDSYRGIPSVSRAMYKVSPPARRGRMALAAKLAAYLIGLAVAGSAMVDWEAWGSAQLPMRQPSVTPLPMRPEPGRRILGEKASKPAQSLLEMEGFAPERAIGGHRSIGDHGFCCVTAFPG